MALVNVQKCFEPLVHYYLEYLGETSKKLKEAATALCFRRNFVSLGYLPLPWGHTGCLKKRGPFFEIGLIHLSIRESF